MRIGNGRPAGVAQIRGDGMNPGLRGMVWFYSQPGGTLVVARVRGLPVTQTGFFALHIHAGEDCAGAGFANTGNHYDPPGRPHPEHAGDLPPLLANGDRAFLAVVTGRFRVGEVIGRTVVIHSGPDDFRTQPSGNAGTKIACGVIRRT